MTSYANTFNPLGADESFDCPQKLSRNSLWIDAPVIASLSGLLRIAGASGRKHNLPRGQLAFHRNRPHPRQILNRNRWNSSDHMAAISRLKNEHEIRGQLFATCFIRKCFYWKNNHQPNSTINCLALCCTAIFRIRLLSLSCPTACKRELCESG